MYYVKNGRNGPVIRSCGAPDSLEKIWLSLPFPQRVFRLKPAALMRRRCSHHVVIVLLNACKSIHLASQHLIRDSDPLQTFLCSYIFPPASPACPSQLDADRSNEQKSSEIIYITPQSAGNWNIAFVLMMSLVLQVRPWGCAVSKQNGHTNV